MAGDEQFPQSTVQPHAMYQVIRIHCGSLQGYAIHFHLLFQQWQQLHIHLQAAHTEQRILMRGSGIYIGHHQIQRKRQRDTSHGDIHTGSFRGIYSSFVHQKVLNGWQINQYT